MRGVAWGLLFLALAGAVRGDDEVKLTNGDRLTGTIKSLADGKLVLATPYAGDLKIDWATVASIRTDAPQKLKLSTGEILIGKLSPGEKGQLKVETPGAVAPVAVELSGIKTLNEPPPQWHGLVNAAGKITEGNTRNKSVLIAAEAKRDTEQDELLARAIFHYGEQDGTLTERNVYGIGKYSYKISPDVYAYLSQEVLSDTFKDIRFESITSVGAGCHLLKRPDLDWTAEAGLAYFDFSYTTVPDESHLGGRVASAFRVALPLGFELKELFIFYPNFKNSQEYELRNEASIGTAVGGGWTLLGGVITEFTNKPVNPALKRTDDTYYLGLGFVF